MANWRESVSIEDEFEEVAKAGLKIVTIMDDSYPANLKEIYDPPIV